MATGGSWRLAASRAVPGVSPRRPYKATGRGGTSAVPGSPRRVSPGSVPGPRACPGPRQLVPTSPATAPGAPTASWTGPTQSLWGCVLPGRARARPSLAGPRLPEGLGRTSPLARRGAEGAGQCLQASLAPGLDGKAAPSLRRSTHPFCGETWVPPHKQRLGCPYLTQVDKDSYSCFSLGVWSTIQNTLVGVPSLPWISLSSDGT